MPASYVPNEFTSCDGDVQDEVGTYTSNGQTITWSQPLAVPATLPWTPRIPASSNCVTFSSAQLYGTGTASPSTTASGSTNTGSTKPSSSTGTAASSAKTGGAQQVVSTTSTGLFALLCAVVALV